jgi:predicted AlkP superfamily pyrophosphatase or phosphodiesterase
VAAKKLVLIVVDGLTPETFERVSEGSDTPALRYLLENGSYTRAASVFPSLTPVCMTSIVTGAHPDVHGIPHLAWYDREAERFVEYGSSFGAVVSAGALRSIRDTIFEMNERHVSPDAVTIYEALDDAGLTTAAVNVTCYRGRTRHSPTIPGLTRSAYGPKRFFYYNLFESDVTGAPLAIRNRAAGTVDAYAAAVGRWLVTRDGFDFLLFYLSDYDFASHGLGPDGADEALASSDRAIQSLFEAAGGADAFLDRYAVVLCSDHGQTSVQEPVRLQDAYDGLRIFRRTSAVRPEIAVAASNRAGMVYRLDACPESVRELAERLDGQPWAEAVCFLEDGDAVVRRDGGEERFSGPDGCTLFDYPDGRRRVWTALHTPRAGDVLVSAAPGYEFADLGGGHHAGGGSHGSLVAGDSTVPVVGVGIEPAVGSITEIQALVLGHFGVAAPAYAHAGTVAV